MPLQRHATHRVTDVMNASAHPADSRAQGRPRGRGRGARAARCPREAPPTEPEEVPQVQETNKPPVQATIRDSQLGRDAGVTIFQFLKLKPPSFTGSNNKEDPHLFIERMEKISKALGCSSAKSVEFAEFQLHDVAHLWFQSVLRERSNELPTMQWDEFRTLFMDRFFPQSMRDAKAREFEVLKQLPGMTVSEYEIQFTQLSRYAPDLVLTERCRIKRFVMGLLKPLFWVLAPHMYNFPSFSAALDCALTIEMRDVEENATIKKRKRELEKRQAGFETSFRGP